MLAIGCSAPESRTPGAAPSALVPASGIVEMAVLPGPLVVLGGERFDLQEFHRFATAADRPFRDRTVNLDPREGTTYADLVQVIDALLLGDCLDIRMVASGT
ncbi:MAG: hypothetical protein ACYTCU_08530 [Planctomycetota bacterium]